MCAFFIILKVLQRVTAVLSLEKGQECSGWGQQQKQENKKRPSSVIFSRFSLRQLSDRQRVLTANWCGYALLSFLQTDPPLAIEMISLTKNPIWSPLTSTILITRRRLCAAEEPVKV